VCTERCGLRISLARDRREGGDEALGSVESGGAIQSSVAPREGGDEAMEGVEGSDGRMAV